VIVPHPLPGALDFCARVILPCGGRKPGDLSMERFLKDREALKRFGFNPDFDQWIYGRNVKF
jgi:hypothetical protein